MLSFRATLLTLLLPLFLLLTPALSSKTNENDRMIPPCIWTCLSNYATDVETFTCETIISHAALTTCIQACPTRDIDNFVKKVLGLPDECEANLYPGHQVEFVSGTVTEIIPMTTEDSGQSRPTGSSDDTSSNDNGGHRTMSGEDGDCYDKVIDGNSTTITRHMSGRCTGTATITGTRVQTGLVTITVTGNSTRTSVRPTSTMPANSGAGVEELEATNMGLMVMAVLAWVLVL